MVVLHGQAPDADTMQAPEGAPSPSRWIAKYLNTRFFRIPPNITIRAREGWEHPRADKDRNLLRQVTGQEPYLLQHTSHRGSVALSNATAHWWILKDEPALTNNSGFVESSGHIAALYQDELYEMSTARAGRARLQNFGVLFGHSRVVIYIEPHTTDEQRLTTNTARTQLLINNDSLPWADWAAEFRDNMPDEIQQLMEEVAAGSSSADHTKSIRDRLKQIMDLYKVSRYRLSAAGRLQIDEQVTSRGGQPGRGEPPSTTGGGARSGKRGGTAGGVYSVFLKKDGPRGDAVQPDPFPDTRWVSVSEGTRAEGDIEDRAARYLSEQNVLLINGDFRVFNDLIDRWTKEFGNQPGIRELVSDAVRGWFEQTLVETVIGVQALKGAKEWTSEDLARALSEEALTSAVLPRYHVNNAVKRELGSKLGKLAS